MKNISINDEELLEHAKMNTLSINNWAGVKNQVPLNIFSILDILSIKVCLN